MSREVKEEWDWWNQLEGDAVYNNAWGFPHYDVEEVASFIEQNADVSGRVLDIGCGPGRLGHTLAARHPAVDFVGVDVSQKMVGLSLQDAPSNWSAEHTDGLTIPHGPFNTVYAVTVFQHLPPGVVKLYFRLVFDALAEGGSLIFTYAVGDEFAPRSYQVTHEEAESWCHQFSAVASLETPDTHPNWNWAVAVK